MKTWWLAIFLGLGCSAGAAPDVTGIGGIPAPPPLSRERAVLHTVAGDIVIAFYPTVAPNTVKQILHLLRMGVYDTAHFFRSEPGFVLQVSVAEDRLTPLTPEQSAAIHKLPLEVTSTVRHHTWSLSMARMPDDPNGAETSFSILLNDAPHLDGQYTIFGQVIRGFDVIGELVRVERDSQNRPTKRLTIQRVDVYDSPGALAVKTLAPAIALSPTATEKPAAGLVTQTGTSGPVTGAVLLIVVIALGTFFLSGKIAPARVLSMHLAIALVGVFILLMESGPWTLKSPAVAALLFGLLIATFRTLGRFDPG